MTNQNFFSLYLEWWFRKQILSFTKHRKTPDSVHLSMFSCQSPFCDNKHIACNNAEILGDEWESCLAHAGTGIFFLIQFHSLIGLYICVCSNQSSRCK